MPTNSSRYASSKDMAMLVSAVTVVFMMFTNTSKAVVLRAVLGNMYRRLRPPSMHPDPGSKDIVANSECCEVKASKVDKAIALVFITAAPDSIVTAVLGTTVWKLAIKSKNTKLAELARKGRKRHATSAIPRT